MTLLSCVLFTRGGRADNTRAKLPVLIFVTDALMMLLALTSDNSGSTASVVVSFIPVQPSSYTCYTRAINYTWRVENRAVFILAIVLLYQALF